MVLTNMQQTHGSELFVFTGLIIVTRILACIFGMSFTIWVVAFFFKLFQQHETVQQKACI